MMCVFRTMVKMVCVFVKICVCVLGWCVLFGSKLNRRLLQPANLKYSSGQNKVPITERLYSRD